MIHARVLVVMIASLLVSAAAGFAQQAALTSEHRALRAASDAADRYAQNTFGLGIVIHVGEDFPNAHFESAEQFADVLVQLITGKYATPAKAFLRPNPGTPVTGLTFHTGPLIHGSENGTEVKSISQSLTALPEIIKALRLVKEMADGFSETNG